MDKKTEESMRIAIFGARGVPAKWGGFDTFVTELAPRLVKAGHEITLFCQPKYTDTSVQRDFQGVRIVRLPTIYGKFTETVVHELLSSLYCLFRPGYDIYYVLGCRSVWVYLLHRLLGRTLVINTDGLDWKRRKWGGFARAYLKFNYWLARRISRYLVSDSKELKKYYLAEHGKETAFLTNGGHLLHKSDLDTESVLKAYGLEERKYYLVACRLEPENNIDIIIREFEQSKVEFPLIIAGGANYKSPYVEALKEAGDKRIRFLGPVYEPGHIESLHLCTRGYIHGHEVGGTNPSLLKAMGCGNVILAHGVGFNAEVLGGTGHLWEKTPGSLLRCLKNVENHYEDYAKRAATECRERIECYYSWDKVAEDHELYFRWVLGRAPSFNESF